ncbi:MAG: tRNA dihydrouridine synthase DusB [Bacteroidetes bacterium]|nr:tRNA dihydrouridine synthase DusB [Bacteroidota bacterium]
MEAITNQPYRKICKRYGADILITEFIASDALARDVQMSVQKMNFDEMERPLGIQIFGNNKEMLVRATEVAQAARPDFIDINWGCPVKKVAGKGSGSGILNNIPKMVELTEAVVKATNLPVTVKTRLGYEEKSKPIVEIAERLQDIGIQAISIHGRTRSQMYKGEADWTLIGEVKNNPRMSIPVFGNGDIDSPQKALEYKNSYGVDGILIGRATIGNPFIFKQTKELLMGEIPSIIPIEEKVLVCKEHLEGLIELRGERNAINEMRKNYSGYFKSLPHFKPFRLKLVTTNDLKEINQTLDELQTFYQTQTFDHLHNLEEE